MPTCGSLEGQVFVADVAHILQFAESYFRGLNIFEKSQLPEFLANKFGRSIPQELRHKGIGIYDFAGVSIEDQNAVLRRFEEPSVTGFRGPQGFLGRPHRLNQVFILI